MNNIKNERGFTLIELLAVIVVLAIVLLMGAMAVIPRMNEARKQVFALEANSAIQSAATYFMDNAISGGDTFPADDGGSKCVSIDTLIDDGAFDADKGKYTGTITVTKKGNLYLYKISMASDILMVTDKGSDETNNKDVVASDVKDLVEGTVKAACS